MAHRNFVDGPWAGQRDDDYSAVPSQRVPVYADPPNSAVCADEQVIKKLGHYERTALDTETGWHYYWRQA